MILFINGEEKHLDVEPPTLESLFSVLVISPKMKIVELNNHLYRESSFSSTSLKGGDIVEIVQFIGGGQ